MARNMVLTYLHQLDPEITIDIMMFNRYLYNVVPQFVS